MPKTAPDTRLAFAVVSERDGERVALIDPGELEAGVDARELARDEASRLTAEARERARDRQPPDSEVAVARDRASGDVVESQRVELAEPTRYRVERVTVLAEDVGEAIDPDLEPAAPEA